MPLSTRAQAGGPRQLFASTVAERVALARTQFFEEGVRPSGLVGEAVIQSWLRCTRAHADTRRSVSFEAVTPSRLHATLARNHELLQAAHGELAGMESALAGTDCRVLLTDAQGVIVHVTHHPAAAQQPILRSTARLGVNIAESVVGTTAPGIVASTGQACTVDGAEHYFECLRTMSCAAAPIRDVNGRLAGVLDLSIESRRFGFDAASMVGLHATTIENRLLVTQSPELLVLRFQASPSLLGTPLEALAGVAADGRVVWLNTAAARLVGGLPEAEPCNVEMLFGFDLATLLRIGCRNAAQPVRLASGLGVWLQARTPALDGIDFGHAVSVSADLPSSIAGPDESTAPAPVPPASSDAQGGDAGADDPSLRGHSRRLIEETLAAHHGNISNAARQLRVSRGTLYRRLRSWRESEAAPPA
ncbi:helix-turn-helix domain-containing protein [Variovorax sp. J22P168]|uniref:helix-turn-helix domain-containing protein n=1 Tax=Variovorax jilinensis TaxID=3053513 RepID=UPI0025778FDD|nr:helix-turn-helix domain-containing protein [Variovorax sp. J22P168]MDM0010997.1 helix-turn-helix domain-containing protein [Variovorax sp. J22P168]